MENLSKENFWKALQEKYPRAVELFFNWIDKYKEEVDWDRLFANGVIQKKITESHISGQTKNTKFHDLPFEMQIGILARFDIECLHGVITGKGRVFYESQRDHYVKGFEELFQDLQFQLNKQKQ